MEEGYEAWEKSKKVSHSVTVIDITSAGDMLSQISFKDPSCEAGKEAL